MLSAPFDIYAPDICLERRNRIRATLAALAYERYSYSIMSDGDFDKLCLLIRPAMRTGHDACDKFFRTEFSPSTGSWILRHPELSRLDARLRQYWPEVTRQ